MQPNVVPPGELSHVHTARDEWAIETMVFQRAVVRELEVRAEAASTGEAACRLWAAVERQAGRYHQHLDPWGELGGFQRSLVEIREHRDSLERSAKRARIEQRRFDDGVRRECRGRLGIRVAVIGKGGAGKTLIASTLARMLARRGRRVLAADLDTCPGLTMSLEVPDAELGLPVGVVEQHSGGNYGWHLSADARPADVVTTCSVAGADGVRLLGIGKIVAVDKVTARRSSSAIVQLLLGFGEPEWDVIADLEAGVTTPFERYHAFADDVLLVVGPGRSSGMAARRLRAMVGARRLTIVANRYRDEPDHPGLTPDVRIPFDATVQSAERSGLSPLDACGDGPAMRALAQLAQRLADQEVAV